MTKEIITTIRCDICGRKGAECYSFHYDRVADAAGGMENVWHDVDLCSAHFAELVRTHGHPSKYRLRLLARSDIMAYGAGVKAWVEMQESIWEAMTLDERKLALAIEAL